MPSADFACADVSTALCVRTLFGSPAEGMATVGLTGKALLTWLFFQVENQGESASCSARSVKERVCRRADVSRRRIGIRKQELQAPVKRHVPLQRPPIPYVHRPAPWQRQT